MKHSVKMHKTAFTLCCVVKIILCAGSNIELEQVLILSRHGIRAPLESVSVTAKKWPKWNVENGHLTPKGAELERNMGEFFRLWLKSKNFTFDTLYAYSSSFNRTIESAKAFIDNLSPNHNVTVETEQGVINNPVFIPLVSNNTEHYKNTIIANMKRKLEAAKLIDAYEAINKILNIENSGVCTNDGLCDLAVGKDKFHFENGEQPYVYGPLHTANAVADAFLMQYYEGMSSEKIAWGQLKNDSMWKHIFKIIDGNLNVRINNTDFSKSAAKHLVKFIYNLLEIKRSKLSILYGHDSSIAMLLSALQIKPYDLPQQNEKTPIGGKIVFLKWKNHRENSASVEINYVYQTMEQLRRGSKLTMEDGPLFAKLQLSSCPSKVAENSCSWEGFIKNLKRLIV